MFRNSTSQLVLRRSQTTASLGLGILRLPVSNHFADISKMVVSPYYQTQTRGRRHTGGDIRFIESTMLGTLNKLLLNDPNIDTVCYAEVSLVNNGAVVAANTVVMDITGVNTAADLVVAAKATIDAFATLNSVTVTEYSLGGASSILPNLPTESALSLSVQTSTGAVGTQVSSTQDAYVMVNTNVSTVAGLASPAAGDLVVEVAPTNSATAGDWVEKARNGNSQSIALLAVSSTQAVKGQMVAYVPKGYYMKVRSITGSGSPTYTIVSARKVLI